MPLLVGLNMQKEGAGALDQTYKCLNKQLCRFFFFLLPSLSEAPLRPPSRLQPPGCASCSPPTPNILIMDEIHLYVAIIVLNCFFEGDSGQQHLADIWFNAWESDFVPSRKPWAWSALFRPFSRNEPESKPCFRANEADPVTELDEVPKHLAFLHMCLNPDEGVSPLSLARKLFSSLWIHQPRLLQLGFPLLVAL